MLTLHGAKKVVTSRARKVWTEEDFFDDVRKNLDQESVVILRVLYEFFKSLGEVRFGACNNATFKTYFKFKGQYVFFCDIISSTEKRNWFDLDGLEKVWDKSRPDPGTR